MNIIIIIFIFIILNSILVILSRNPIHSILNLVLVFLFSVILFMILGAEFVSLLVLIVYVGAISILFLFVIMMLNLRIVEAYKVAHSYLPIVGFVGFFFMLVLISFLNCDFGLTYFNNNSLNKDWANIIESPNNIVLIGEVLYNNYIYLFILASLVLLSSMLGSVVLVTDNQLLRKDKGISNYMRHNLIGVLSKKEEKLNNGKS